MKYKWRYASIALLLGDHTLESQFSLAFFTMNIQHDTSD